MVALISTKENKKDNIKLTKYLEKKNFETWNFWKDTSGLNSLEAFKKHLNNFSIIVFIITKQSIQNKLIISLYKLAFEKNKEIILFVQSKLDFNLPNWFFLENHNWINAYEVSFDTSAQGLLDLLSEYSENKISTTEGIEQIKNKEKNKKSLYIILGIFIIIAVIYFLYQQNNQDNRTTKNTSIEKIITKSKGKKYEELIIGTWRLKNYYDDIKRNSQELIQYQQTIESLKQTFVMTFYDNNTFIRKGFTPQEERGFWRVDEQNNYLYITDLNKTGEDRLKILTLTKDEFIFEIPVYTTSQQINIVRLSLYKVSQN